MRWTRAVWVGAVVVMGWFGGACATPAPPKPAPPEVAAASQPAGAPASAPSSAPSAAPAQTAELPALGGDGFGDRGYLVALERQWRERPEDAGRFMRVAVLRGLYLDGVGATVARRVAEEADGPNWVPKCPICRPTEAAFAEHAQKVKADNLGPLHGPLRDLTAKDQAARHAAINALVHRWVEGAMEAYKITGAAQEALRGELESDRKRGMSGKPEHFKSCPSCDGATGVDPVL